ncbi:MFS transporter [Nocardioides acrostichi]|uniref:MFS transporter n=1 Tax=Nocardioides acrostichi TaxID=2784339 RepID=A0A930UZD8_9ACTN|nr:MFS transporter [Nocardioides acrostichi]MBF4163693.1 MFS transporter [Nocardioides acrostichi]
MRTYREVFSYPEFRVLFIVRCVTMGVVSLQSLALASITYAATASPLLTALVLFGGPLITMLGSATVLGASDSLGVRRASLVMPAAYGVACLLQAIPHLPWWSRLVILALPYLAGSATSGSTMRLMHQILPDDGFVLGRATLNLAVGVMQVVGYAAGGVLIAHLPVSAVFLLAAGGALAVVLLLRFGISERPGTQPSGRLVQRTRAVNRHLLGSPVTRPVYLALWIPNGLIVGCEALFLPFSTESGVDAAGLLFAVTAAGMLTGDVVMGRLVPPTHRDRVVTPLRLLLALPYLGFALDPGLPVALVLGFVASVGYCASLPLQERLVHTTDPANRGQVFGLAGSGLMIGQATGAALGGAIAEVLDAHLTMALLAAASLFVSALLTPALRRSAPASARHNDEQRARGSMHA